MRARHGDARIWILAALVGIAGLALYRYIPQSGLASESLAVGLIVLMVLKHVGLAATFGTPLIAFVLGRLLPRLRRRAADHG